MSVGSLVLLQALEIGTRFVIPGADHGILTLQGIKGRKRERNMMVITSEIPKLFVSRMQRVIVLPDIPADYVTYTCWRDEQLIEDFPGCTLEDRLEVLGKHAWREWESIQRQLKLG